MNKVQFLLDKDFQRLYKAVAEVVNFCYDDGKGWIGTENIRKSGQFVKRMSELWDAIIPFEPTEDFYVSNVVYSDPTELPMDWELNLTPPDPDELAQMDAQALELAMDFVAAGV